MSVCLYVSGGPQLLSLNLKCWHFVIFLARVMIFGMLHHQYVFLEACNFQLFLSSTFYSTNNYVRKTRKSKYHKSKICFFQNFREDQQHVIQFLLDLYHSNLTQTLSRVCHTCSENLKAITTLSREISTDVVMVVISRIPSTLTPFLCTFRWVLFNAKERHEFYFGVIIKPMVFLLIS